MPRGVYSRSKSPIVIDVPSARSGLRGRIDKWLADYSAKVQALKIVSDMIDADDRATALDAAPRKFLNAMNQRPGATVPKKKRAKVERRLPAERLAEMTHYLSAHPGAPTHQIAAALNISVNTVRKFASKVARRQPGHKFRQEILWTLK